MSGNGKSSTTANLLALTSQEVAIQEAIDKIQEEATGRVNGLYTRWEGVNRAKMKYWRFGSVTLMAGMSGSGKSAILNMIEDDFTNPEINPTYLLKHNNNDNSWLWDGEKIYEPKVRILAFKFEMRAADELIRNISGKLGKSYSYILSSEVQRTQGVMLDPLVKASYNRIDDNEMLVIRTELEKQKNRPITYVESAGNLEQMEMTLKHFRESYPGDRIIVTIDHTLLALKISEKDDLELMSRTARMGIKWSKTYNANVIFLGQMNGEIEKPIRRDNPDLHFPVKTDIHGGNQVFWACDDVIIWHRPDKLNISKYGKVRMFLNPKEPPSTESVNAAGIIHANWVKSRFNREGSIWFRNAFEKGSMFQVDERTIRFINDPL